MTLITGMSHVMNGLANHFDSCHNAGLVKVQFNGNCAPDIQIHCILFFDCKTHFGIVRDAECPLLTKIRQQHMLNELTRYYASMFILS